MEKEFWHRKWEKDEIAFHERRANPLLANHFSKLSLPEGSRVFVPLCGKTLDIHWLLDQGYRVAGVELSKIAVDQLFADLNMTPQVANEGALLHYSADRIDIFVGDLFALSTHMLGAVDAIYDRAALIALPAEQRKRYASHVTEISRNAAQLLVCLEYDQSLMQGPPFSVDDDEVNQQYAGSYRLTLLEKAPIAGGFKGKIPATEPVWLLTAAPPSP